MKNLNWITKCVTRGVMDPKLQSAEKKSHHACISNVTFYCSENEEGDDGVVQTTGWLGDAGQDGERVQQVTVREEETIKEMWQ